MPVMSRSLSEIQQQMERLSGETTNDFGFPMVFPLHVQASVQKWQPLQAWTPAIELVETATHYCLRVEIPGITARNVQWEVQGNRVIIHGTNMVERESSNKEADPLTHCSELRYGRFMRQVPLPGPVAQQRASQKIRNGILEIRLPKGT